LSIACPESTGPTLIRGQQIDGHDALRFGLSVEDDLLLQLNLPARSGGSNRGGLGALPSRATRRAPGCYAYWLKGLSVSEVVVFQIVP
jgi:hypothetical protein